MVTKHAKRRLKERMGVNKGTVDEAARRALKEGIHHNQARGDLQKWIDAEFLKYHTANNCRYFANKLYIFHNDCLITVLDDKNHIDENLRQNVESDKLYIEYRKKRFSRIKNPEVKIKKLITELNVFIPDVVRELVTKYDIPVDVAEVKVNSNLKIVIKYKPWCDLKKKAFNLVKADLMERYGLPIEKVVVRTVALLDKKSSWKTLHDYLSKERFLTPKIINPLLIRRDIYESEAGYCIFVASGEYHFPKASYVYSCEKDELKYLYSTVCSSDKYTFSVINNSPILNLFENELEALSYLSLIQISKDINTTETEGFAVFNGNYDMLDRLKRENPQLSVVRICGTTAAISSDDEDLIRYVFGDSINVVRYLPYFKKYNYDLQYFRTGIL